MTHYDALQVHLQTLTNTYAVVALFAETEIGTSIARSEWPAHVTLVSNFVVAASAEVVTHTVRRALTDRAAIEARLAGPAMFGPDGAVPVQLVEADPFLQLHGRLAAAVERLPNFRADEPQYWHDEYRPHITRRVDETLREGESWPVVCVATALLTERHGTIIDVIAV